MVTVECYTKAKMDPKIALFCQIGKIQGGIKNVKPCLKFMTTPKLNDIKFIHFF